MMPKMNNTLLMLAPLFLALIVATRAADLKTTNNGGLLATAPRKD